MTLDPAQLLIVFVVVLAIVVLANAIGIRKLLVIGAFFEIAGSLTLVALPSVRAVQRRTGPRSVDHAGRDAPSA